MSYNSQMFARMSDELERIVGECENDNSTMGIEDVDVYGVLVSIARLTSVFGKGYELAGNALRLAVCEFGDMSDMVEEMEIVDDLSDELLKWQEYECASTENYCIWVKRWSE